MFVTGIIISCFGYSSLTKVSRKPNILSIMGCCFFIIYPRLFQCFWLSSSLDCFVGGEGSFSGCGCFRS